VLARSAALVVGLSAVSLAVTTPARAQVPAPPAPPAATPGAVLVHIATPNEVDLEVRRGSDWVPICTSPCDRLVRPGDSYRVSSDDVPASNVFAIQPAPRVTLRVDPSTKQSHVGGIVLTILGAAGFVPGVGVTIAVAGFFLGGAILVCPIAAAFNANYGNCVVGAAGLVTPTYASPYVWGPAIAGAVLLVAGVAWLAAASGGHDTNVTTALALPKPPPVLAALPVWHTLTSSEGALPPPAVVPVLGGTF
jgi:hypothetical protein